MSTAKIHEFKNKILNLFTEADKSNDLRSLERRLDAKLILLVKQKVGTQDTWIMPQGRHQPGESMRQVSISMCKRLKKQTLQEEYYISSSLVISKLFLRHKNSISKMFIER